MSNEFLDESLDLEKYSKELETNTIKRKRKNRKRINSFRKLKES